MAGMKERDSRRAGAWEGRRTLSTPGDLMGTSKPDGASSRAQSSPAFPCFAGRELIAFLDSLARFGSFLSFFFYFFFKLIK